MKKTKLISIVVLLGIVGLILAYFLTTWNIAKQKDTAVIKEIRSLNRWETASYTVEQIIDTGNTGNAFTQFLFGDKILLVAHGTVTGGFDLANLSDKDVHIDGKSITLSLPAPQILTSSLDESETRVYDRQKGILVHADNNLESQARIDAVTKIRAAACSGGVLTITSDNAKKQLTSMLQALGFTNITLTVPQGHC